MLLPQWWTLMSWCPFTWSTVCPRVLRQHLQSASWHHVGMVESERGGQQRGKMVWVCCLATATSSVSLAMMDRWQQDPDYREKILMKETERDRQFQQQTWCLYLQTGRETDRLMCFSSIIVSSAGMSGVMEGLSGARGHVDAVFLALCASQCEIWPLQSLHQ